MRILVKIGGAQLGNASTIAKAVGAARAVGHEVILVHGGGDQLRDWSQQLGLEDEYIQGLRVTDAKTARVVTAVLGGEVNAGLVKTLCAAGIPAVGLTGADGNFCGGGDLKTARWSCTCRKSKWNLTKTE